MNAKTMLTKIKAAGSMTTLELADALGVRERTVWRWMNAEKGSDPKPPNLRAIRALAARYGVRP